MTHDHDYMALAGILEQRIQIERTFGAIDSMVLGIDIKVSLLEQIIAALRAAHDELDSLINERGLERGLMDE